MKPVGAESGINAALGAAERIIPSGKKRKQVSGAERARAKRAREARES